MTHDWLVTLLLCFFAGFAGHTVGFIHATRRRDRQERDREALRGAVCNVDELSFIWRPKPPGPTETKS